MANRYLVVSDLHISDIEEHDDGWKAFKSARYLIDDEFEALVERSLEQTGETHGALTLVLNGDIIDFDVVTAVPDHPAWPVSRDERARGLLPTEEKAVWKLRRVLAHHPKLIAALARFLESGHRIVYVMGNHDREFHFPGVKAAFIEAIERFTVTKVAGSIRFEPWFLYVPGEIYAEHGQQYDFYSSFRNILAPTVETREGAMIAIPMGNLSGRVLASQMGFFNPYSTEFILNVFAYFAHWFRYYAFTRRSLILKWFWGSLLVIGRLLRQKKQIHERPRGFDGLLDEAARGAGLPRATIDALGDMHRKPITTTFFRILREFWIDRLLIAVFMTGGTIALALVPIPLWIKLVVPLSCFPLTYFIYEWFARGESVFTVEHEVPMCAARVADLLRVRVVTFGHTHRPRVIPLSKDATFVDTGTWAPLMSKENPDALARGYRNYLFVSFDDGRVSLSLGSWM